MYKALIRTYGCQMNERDSENIAANFAEMGWEMTEDESLADVIIVNTCSVRGQAEQKALGKLRHLVSARRCGGSPLPIVGVTGCMAQNLGAKIARDVPGIDFVIGSKQTHKAAEISADILKERISAPTSIESVGKKITRETAGKLAARTKIDISDDPLSHLSINRHLPSSLGASANPCAFVSVMQGCEMKCSYCIVPKVRGEQRSRPSDDIVEEIATLAARGVKEVCLLGQVVNAFGRDKSKSGGGDDFVELLRRVNNLKGIERIRFTSPHPSYFNDALIDSYGSLEKLCEYVHLPLQSGSDAVLKRMRRPYGAERFLAIASKLRSRVNLMSISTDIIVGYPGETDEDFEQTLKVFKESLFDMAFIFKYSPREGTKSAELPDDVPEDVKESRNQALLDVLAKQSLDFNDRLVGTEQEILVEAPAKRGDGKFMGKTRTHRKVIFSGSTSDIGKLVKVSIKSATVTALDASLGSEFHAQ